jgi:hypothetical protein
MPAVPNLVLDTQGSYRVDCSASKDGPVRQAARHLQTASDALALAQLSLGEKRDETRGDRLQRAENARSFLAEAVTALSRARVHVRGIHTHSLHFLMAAERSLDAELSRLHQIANRLIWQNHMYLPARNQAKPLTSEEEAQLAVVVQELSRNAKIQRIMRYKWAALGVLAAVAVNAVGLPFAGMALAAAGLSATAFQLLGDRRRSSG